MFLNENGWLVMAPYEYSGETLSETGYSKKEMVGEYEFVIHKPNMFFQTVLNKQIGIIDFKHCLYSDGSVVGDVTGTWSYKEVHPICLSQSMVCNMTAYS